MPNGLQEGPSEPVAGVARSLQDLSLAELTALPPKPARPEYMVTRFPVDMDEFQRLLEAAEQPDPEAPALAVEDQADVDAEVAAIVEGDPAEDEPPGGPQPQAPPIGASFEGITQTAWLPPDCAMAVGPDDVLLAVNADLVGFRKDGSVRFRWPNMSTLFGPVLPSGATLFDPKLAYDHYSGRFVVVTGARRGTPAGSWIMVAVSQGADPQGPYWVWALDATLDGSNPTNNWADYPMLGFDTQGIYIAANMFQMGGGYQYAKLRILNKAELYAGGSGPNHFIRWYDYWGFQNPGGQVVFTLQPAAHYRGTGGNPPAYLVNALWPGGTTLTLWRMDNPLAFWLGGSTTITANDVSCRSYDLPPAAQQPGSTTPLATNDARLLNAVFQNAGGVQRLWTCHTSKFTWSGESVARSVVQWYEIDVNSHAVVQQNAFGASGAYYFFPVIQTDVRRNAYLAFSRSSATQFGMMRATGRQVTSPANDLESSVLIKAGESTYTGGRWGDYFGIGRDGGDANRVWMYGQFADTGNTWGTWVCSAKY